MDAREKEEGPSTVCLEYPSEISGGTERNLTFRFSSCDGRGSSTEIRCRRSVLCRLPQQSQRTGFSPHAHQVQTFQIRGGNCETRASSIYKKADGPNAGIARSHGENP